MELEIQTEQEAYLAIMYACMSVDERVTEDETDEVINTLVAHKIFKNADLVAIYKKIHLINQAIRYDAFKLVELAVPKISNESKPVVYQTAASLLQADGVVFGVEKDLLQYLQRALKIDDISTGAG
jgi:6-phosphogluconolactonase/glucosamine-6-phosphate isomerase/deaminase